MKLIRAIPYAALFWALIFIAISIIIFLPISGAWQIALHFIVAPLLTFFVAWLYFKDAKAGWKEGVKLAIILFVIGSILDLAITIPLFVKSLSAFYTWDLWVGISEMVLVSVLSGKLFEKGKAKKTKPKKKAKKKKRK